jgi:hypothetical protein
VPVDFGDLRPQRVRQHFVEILAGDEFVARRREVKQPDPAVREQLAGIDTQRRPRRQHAGVRAEKHRCYRHGPLQHPPGAPRCADPDAARVDAGGAKP